MTYVWILVGVVIGGALGYFLARMGQETPEDIEQTREKLRADRLLLAKKEAALDAKLKEAADIGRKAAQKQIQAAQQEAADAKAIAAKSEKLVLELSQDLKKTHRRWKGTQQRNARKERAQLTRVHDPKPA